MAFLLAISVEMPYPTCVGRWLFVRKMMDQEAETTRREYLAFEAVDPETGKNHRVQISYDRLHAVAERGKGFVFEAAYSLPHILLKPTAVFEGLCSEDDEDARGYGWRCYCGVPPCRYQANGEESEVPENRVFLAFVNTDWVVYNWRWEPTDSQKRNLPTDYQRRFRRSLI